MSVLPVDLSFNTISLLDRFGLRASAGNGISGRRKQNPGLFGRQTITIAKSELVAGDLSNQEYLDEIRKI